MTSLISFNKEIRRHNLDLSHRYLTHIFSTYPYPENLDACPCCVNPEDLDQLKRGYFDKYLHKAMTTWGNAYDFKHYLPQLFKYVYLDKTHDNTFMMGVLINRARYWSDEEYQAIENWFYDYFQHIYINEFEDRIQNSRLLAQNFLDGLTENLSCELPLSIFFDADLEDIMPYLPSKIQDSFSKLLAMWPQNLIDIVVLASCLANSWFMDINDKKFCKEKVMSWIQKNEKIIEEQFWETTKPYMQKIYSEALEKIKWSTYTDL